MNYRIISADCHIDMTWMPGDLWVRNAPAKFCERVPQVRQTEQGRVLSIPPDAGYGAVEEPMENVMSR